MATSTQQRTFLGKAQTLGLRQRVYLCDRCVEIDELDYYEVSRSRVFYEDIWAITRHRIYGWMYLLTMGLLGGLLILIAVLVLQEDTTAGIIFLLIASPFAFLFTARLILSLDVITIQGKRTKAVMHFFFRKKRAGDVFDLLVLRTRNAQQKVQVAANSAPPVPASEFSPPPAPAEQPVDLST